MKDDPVAFLDGFHKGDSNALAKALREHLARGDFNTWPEVITARWRLWRAERALTIASGLTLEGIALRQARAAEHSAVAAYLALALSILSLGVAFMAYLKSLEQQLQPASGVATAASTTAGKSSPPSRVAASRP